MIDDLLDHLLVINIQVSTPDVSYSLEFSRQNSTACLLLFQPIPPFVFESFRHCHSSMWVTQLLIFKYLQSLVTLPLFLLNIFLKTLYMKYHYLVSEKDLINGGLPVNDSAISLRFVLVLFFRCDWAFLHWNFVRF